MCSPVKTLTNEPAIGHTLRRAAVSLRGITGTSVAHTPTEHRSTIVRREIRLRYARNHETRGIRENRE